MDGYNQNQPQGSGSSGFGLLNVVFILIGLFAIYYMYRFLYTSSNSTAMTIFGAQQAANMPPNRTTIPVPPAPFEGGEYSVNTWVYINSFSKNMNTRKHVLELKGKYFSSLLIALGAFKNSLTVRTHTKEVVAGFQDGGDYYDNDNGDAGQEGDGAAGLVDGEDEAPSTTTPPNAANIGDLSVNAVNALFKPIAMDDEILKTPLQCDLTEIDLQRWTMITVVLSGRTIDVYIDGKLKRSCVTKSYYKVDPTGVTMNLVDRGGFDGYLGNTVAGAYGMNPDEIYRMYLSGPSGTSMDIISWIASLFKGARTS